MGNLNHIHTKWCGMTASSAELFPDSPREIYTNTPTVQVICQLRFPSLLSIESKPPVDFQERIRDHFPLLERTGGSLPAEIPPEIAKLVQPQIGTSGYQFLTQDRASTVTLEPSSLALTTTNYTQWEHFRDELRLPLAALNEIYRPSFFSRVGLRYQDAIDRAKLGLHDTPWSALLNPDILGELALPQFETNLEDLVNRAIRVKIPDGSGSMVMRHGLGNLQGREQSCYMIDMDFFTEQQTEVTNAEPALNHFNVMVGQAFRWCISDTLRVALDPRELAAASG